MPKTLDTRKHCLFRRPNAADQMDEGLLGVINEVSKETVSINYAMK